MDEQVFEGTKTVDWLRSLFLKKRVMFGSPALGILYGLADVIDSLIDYECYA